MVVSRTANIRQATASIRESGVRSMSQLPALSAPSATDSGPLRVTVHYHHNPALGSIAGANHTTPSALRRYTRSYTDNVVSVVSKSPVGVEEGRGVRRVRFDLPPKPPLPSLLHSGATSGKLGQQKQAAGVESWLRSRASISSSFGSSLSREPQLNNSVGGGYLTGASRAVLATTAVAAARTHDTERYRRGTLPPTSPPGAACPGTDCSPEAAALLKAARDGDEDALGVALREADRTGLPAEDLNCQDSSGRTPVSYIVSNGLLSMLEAILELPGVDVNKPDNEGNTPLHFAAQAGHVEVINFILGKCTVEVDARNALGFTPLMKAALQGRTKCAKILLLAGASPTLRDTGRGLRAEQWARFCGRYVCAEVIEKFARHRLLERTTSYGRWGSEPELGTRLLMGAGKTSTSSGQNSSQSTGFKSRLRRAFRTNTSASQSPPGRYSLVTQLTTAALCASSPVLPTPNVPPVVKSLMRPLTVPKLQVTPATSVETSDTSVEYHTTKDRPPTARPSSTKLKKKK